MDCKRCGKEADGYIEYLCSKCEVELTEVLEKRFPDMEEPYGLISLELPEKILQKIEDGDWVIIYNKDIMEEYADLSEENLYTVFDKNKRNDDVEDFVNERLKDLFDEEELSDGCDEAIYGILWKGQEVGSGWGSWQEKYIIEGEEDKSRFGHEALKSLGL